MEEIDDVEYPALEGVDRLPRRLFEPIDRILPTEVVGSIAKKFQPKRPEPGSIQRPRGPDGFA